MEGEFSLLRFVKSIYPGNITLTLVSLIFFIRGLFLMDLLWCFVTLHIARRLLFVELGSGLN